jgi:glycosyltransferase involved in cell wall biosynthesis
MGNVEVQRVTRFVCHLPHFGWDPVVLTAGRDAHPHRDESLLMLLPPSVPIVRIADITHPSTMLATRPQKSALLDGLRRRVVRLDRQHFCFPDPMNWWARRAARHARRMIRTHRPDVLWSTGYPWSVLCLLAKVASESGLPSIGDIRDPWSWHPRRFWDSERHRRLERSTLLSFSHVVSATDGLNRRYQQLYPELRGRITTVRNSFDDADVNAAKPRAIPSLFSYVGSLSTGDVKDPVTQTLDPFLKALRLCLDRNVDGSDRIRVQAAGQGVERTQSLVAEYRLNDRVRLQGPVPQADARALRAKADVLVVVMGNGDGSEAFVPLKIYEYLAANRPILALLPRGSEAGEIIRKKKRGVVCRVDDLESICDGIRRILAGDFEYDLNADLAEFSARSTAAQLAGLLERVTPSSSSPRLQHVG